MKKIDAHLHLVQNIAGFNGKGRLNALGNGDAIWDDGTLIHLLPNEYGETDFTAEAVLRLMDTNGIDKAMVLQGSLNGYQNYYTWQTMRQYPDRFMGAFSVDPFTEQFMTILQRHVRDLGFRSMKLEISAGGGMHGYHVTTPFRLDLDPRVGQMLHYLANYPGFNIIVDYGSADQISHQPEAIVNLAQRYPMLNFVVCHLSFGQTNQLALYQNTLDQWQPFTNIYTDLAAIQDINDETSQPYMASTELVKRAYQTLGSERLLWGTDSPWSATFNAYADLASWLEKADIMPTSALENVYYQNAERLYFNSEAKRAVLEAVDPSQC
ncbi:putative TIM-barrel fold metal-dependent hydrolase [Weissella uvarum]|uniref:amidohydrolase family protein n=1 Tax=Weissella uvarum TaxID=1479233 RepID=UPI0019621F7E|nr:amidohydrolase family protein [Weissella uvarum]MBM7616645.1 putative TIM-barrel fold metal-dependent hydrolase [Weissella uvarum]MCM0594897.1 amidohydrolase [Weissella uvarum]